MTRFTSRLTTITGLERRGEYEADAAIEVSIGMGDECTMTNTAFFGGIPTLNQYGMAVLALLMLGMGFIGMCRLV